MEDNNSGSSGTNTILIVLVLLILVGFGVWWFTSQNKAPQEDPGINIDVTLPAGENSNGSAAE